MSGFGTSDIGPPWPAAFLAGLTFSGHLGSELRDARANVVHVKSFGRPCTFKATLPSPKTTGIRQILNWERVTFQFGLARVSFALGALGLF